MSDYYENTQHLDRKCPLCGGSRTRFGESYSDGDEYRENSFSRQQCRECGLGCKHWDAIDAQAARLAVVEEALKQYADPENWSCSDDEHDHRNGHCCLDVWDATTNGYEVAQAALAHTLPELLAKVEAEHER